MIKIENLKCIADWESVIRGMRNPMNSWDKSDSLFLPLADPSIGENDIKLMERLAEAGKDHGKYLRMVPVMMDITAPLYWWKEFDTYKVGTVANSCSTMHKIHSKEFTLDDFSHDHLNPFNLDQLKYLITVLNADRDVYLRTKEKEDWWQMIQMLPSSYNQKRTVFLNYQVLNNMYCARKNHKLDEWREFCEEIQKFPFSGLFTGNKEYLRYNNDK